MTTLLIIIDVQAGFITPATANIPQAVESLQDRFDTVIITKFVNPEGSAQRRLIDWCQFAPGSPDTELAFTPKAGATIIEKRSYSAIDAAFLERLDALGAKDVHLCGIATDNCVLVTAVDLFEAGLRPVVLADYCASHGGPEYHDWGLKILTRLIGPRQVVAGRDAPAPTR
jgi:nicotinamidase-related amidase